MIQKTVVLLLSDKRSGSTMFLRELCKHLDIQAVDYSPHNLETHHWPQAALVLGMNPETFTHDKVYSSYGSISNARIYLIDLIRQNVPGFQVTDSNHDLVFMGWEALCNQYAKPVFFEKTPKTLGHWAALSLILKWMQKTEFRVKIIGLIRNPLSVMYSAFQLFHTDPVKRQYSWLNMYKNLLAFQSLIPEDDFLQVRYEDIVRNPVSAFAEICDFIGVSRSAIVGNNVHSKSLTKWQNDLYFTLRLDSTVKQMAERFGYSKEELENPIKPEPPLSYRLKRAWKKTYRLTLSRFVGRFVKPMYLRVKWELFKDRRLFNDE